ncbi:hypothetical protein J5289_03565 [Rhizobium sp. B230/85]|uniref:hypothetical protein n=1 Tax=unclassified Rhizobium TaxID=2613769 RepID=UPI001AD9D290|nr:MULTISPECIES: hypothetical protein [unclassified Rhizobium]MBO9134199.1 hypothetical protein [Rhizobium sp. B209b/85]QXZ96673.1 hypothetical protein J5289_03565 [Rhizobium sp. B230/85]
MPTELQLLTKRAADLRKMMKEEATKQTPTKANRRADVVHNAADRQLNAAIARERTLAARILEIQGLLATGNFRTIEQLATAMEKAVPQVRWALFHGKQRGSIPNDVNLDQNGP